MIIFMKGLQTYFLTLKTKLSVVISVKIEQGQYARGYLLTCEVFSVECFILRLSISITATYDTKALWFISLCNCSLQQK